MVSSTSHGSRAAYLLAYVLWALTGVLGLVALARLREAVLHGVVLVGWSPWVWGLVDKAALIVLGLSWLVLVLVCEASFRTGVRRGTLFRRAGTVVGAEIALALVSHLVTLMRP